MPSPSSGTCGAKRPSTVASRAPRACAAVHYDADACSRSNSVMAAAGVKRWWTAAGALKRLEAGDVVVHQPGRCCLSKGTGSRGRRWLSSPAMQVSPCCRRSSGSRALVAHQYFLIKPFRAVRPAPGLGPAARPDPAGVGVPHAVVLQAGRHPIYSLPPGFLGDAVSDCGQLLSRWATTATSGSV